MWCFISEPNGIIHEFVLPNRALGSECFEKVCEKLKLVEKDYFGLKFRGPKGAEVWLNLRNPLAFQLFGKPPFRLHLLTKYFVRPQELQQEVTRQLYYETLKKYLSEGKFDLSQLQANTVAKICALIAQIEWGNFNPEKIPNYSAYIPKSIWSLLANSSDLQKDAGVEHAKIFHMSANEAKIEFLHLSCSLPGYGAERFYGKIVAERPHKRVDIIVNSEGLKVYSNEREFDIKQGKEIVRYVLEQRISFEDVSTVSYNSKCFTVVYNGPEGQNMRVSYKLKNEQLAIALFRTFTEFHTFYQCSTVKKSVIEQCTRTPIGRVVSFFKPRSGVGRMFLFDVCHTRRQAYSHAWAELNSELNQQVAHTRNENQTSSEESVIGEYRPVQSPLVRHKSTTYSTRKDGPTSILSSIKDCSEKDGIENLDVDQLKTLVHHLQDARICQICMDEEVATAFCPCGHVVCCVECSAMCRECPLCRRQITYAQRVFFP